MQPGDIVLYRGCRWKVISHDRPYRICTLSNWERERVEVGDDLDGRRDSGLILLHEPSTWPFLAVRGKAKAGYVTEVHRGGQQLQPLQDWTPSGMFSTGGSLFFNPALGLQPGEVLTLLHERGARSRVSITRSFGTLQHKRQRAAKPWKPREPTSAYDRLMGDDDPFGDE